MPANVVLSSLLASYGDSGAKKLPQFVLSIDHVSNSSVALATAMSHFASAVSDDQQEERRANATLANTRDVTL